MGPSTPDPVALLAEQSPTGVAVVDSDGTVTYANPALARLLGRTAAGLVGTPLEALLHRDGPPAASLLLPAYGVQEAERRFPTPQGEVVGLVTAAVVPGVAGRVLYVEDVTRVASLEREVHTGHLADPETGLAGGALLRDRLEHALALRDRDPSRAVSCCIVAVPDEGDLATVARALVETVRSTDTLARVDRTLVVVCEDTNDRGMRALRHRLRGLAEVQEQGATIGVATARAGQSAFDLLNTARQGAREDLARRWADDAPLAEASA
ncbi:PAS domain S-box-containing protein [Motilibacter rhizosphaerae]|uniref:PAS domain S-box-containing protein n=1 Tax=Motilibacter rhizosphaerae TaxID=598652 RepID=A0A4V2F4F9_9ACTN|nr:PAS domain-containing protein [Motilibacter rhizosphaerae]RZS87467.1 PAS domain S-box-containing protein [Motilibacter rhizosphaerae]